VSLVLLPIKAEHTEEIVRMAKVRDIDLPVVARFEWRMINGAAITKVGRHTVNLEWMCNAHELAELENIL
jgi:hypothetical protein